jgi:heat shock protein HslJ
MKRYLTALALVLALGGAAGCAEYTTTGVPADGATGAAEAGEALAPDADPLVGTSWKLTSSTSSADLADFAITATFAEGTMSGQAPVNSYNAAYTVEADTQIQIGPVASTKMAGEPAAMTAEGAYFALLEQVTGFVVSPEELQLTADGEAVLVYGPASGAGEGADPGAEQAAATQEFADTLVGKTAEDAEAATAEAGFQYRVVSEDGEDKPVTADYIPTRVNVTLEDGEVTKAGVG